MPRKNSTLLRYAAVAVLATTGLVGLTAAPASAHAECSHTDHSHFHLWDLHTDYWKWLGSAGAFPNVSETFENVTHRYFETKSGCMYLSLSPEP